MFELGRKKAADPLGDRSLRGADAISLEAPSCLEGGDTFVEPKKQYLFTSSSYDALGRLGTGESLPPGAVTGLNSGGE